MGELITVESMPEVVTDEDQKIIDKLRQMDEIVKKKQIRPSLRGAIDWVLGRAEYEIDTSPDDVDREFAKGAIILVQEILRK